MIILADRSGNVIRFDERALVEAARHAGCVLELVPMMGEFAMKGAPLFRVSGDPSRLDRERLRRLVTLGDEMTYEGDPVYGFRKLVDVAQRSLGTAQNDVTTAVQVINRFHDCLRQIAPRPFPPGENMDARGELRLVVRSISWDGYVRLAFDEIRLAAGLSASDPAPVRGAGGPEDGRAAGSPGTARPPAAVAGAGGRGRA